MRTRRPLGLVTALLLASGMLILPGRASAEPHPGDLDTTFGAGGVVSFVQDPRDAVLQSTGKTVTLAQSGDGYCVLFRHMPSGVLDTTFGTDGVAFPRENPCPTEIHVTADDRLLLAGGAGPMAFALHAYAADGDEDLSYGDDGSVSLYDAWWGSAAVDAGGRAYVVGCSDEDTNAVVVLRFTPAGRPDTSFGTDGRTVVPMVSAGYAPLVSADADGSSVVAGSGRDGFVAAKLRPDGRLDTGYGNGGVAAHAIGAGLACPASGHCSFDVASAVLRDGSLTLFGDRSVEPVADDDTPPTGADPLPRAPGEAAVVERLRADGSLDQDLMGRGFTLLPLSYVGDGLVEAGLSPVVLSPEGLTRLRGDGVVEPGFGSDGTAQLPCDWPLRVLRQPDGKYVVAGAGWRGENGLTRLQGGSTPEPPTGYTAVGRDGSVYAFGNGHPEGSTWGVPLAAPVVGGVRSGGDGYWLAASDGGVFSFGDARFLGSTGAVRLNKPVVGMAATASGKGYWLVASDGGVFSFGDARFFGSTGAVRLNKPVVGMAVTASGNGYWLVASDGGVFSFGDAGFHGSTGDVRLNQPVVGMAATSSGHGYWMVASDGGIFSFGDAAFHGSTGGVALSEPVAGMAAIPGGGGYRLVASDGGIFTFGEAAFYGSTGSVPIPAPITGIFS